MKLLKARTCLVRNLVACSVVWAAATALSGCGDSDSNSGNGTPAADSGPNCPTGTNDAGTCNCDPAVCNGSSACVGNACLPTCKSHTDCAAGSDCTPSKTDTTAVDVNVCKPSALPSGKGQFLTACPNDNECDTASGFICLGGGAGDTDAYCSRFDCHNDSECPGGMYCGVMRRPYTVCGQPDAGGDPDAGPCVDPASFTADGGTYREGPYMLLRNVCLRRSYCSPCQTDLDCSRSAVDQTCVSPEAGVPGYCTRTCNKDITGACPWQGASQCTTKNTSVGPTCNPTYGQCVGDKSPCSPCHNDEDCWSGSGPRKMCLTNSFSREPFCVDIDTPCTSDDQCPLSAGGVRMQCMTDSAYQGSIVYQRCYPASNNPLQYGQASCYGAP